MGMTQFHNDYTKEIIIKSENVDDEYVSLCGNV